MDVSFTKPKFSVRLFAFLIDLTCIVITTLLLVLASMNIMNNVPFYKEANTAIDNLQYSSHLYVKRDDGSLKLMCDHFAPYEEDDYKKYNKMFDEALTLFYSDPIFFDQDDPKSGLYLYNTQKIPEGQNRSELFIYSDSTHSSIVEDPNADVVKIYDFYVDIMSGQAIKYLINNNVYYEASKTISLSFVFIILLIPIIISSTIFELIIPLILSRGKKTIGKLLFKISVVDVRGLSCSYKRYIFRFLVLLFIETLLSIVALLIPLIVSFSMLLFTKTNQSFHDYVTNTYIVEAPSSSICKTPEEYFKKHSHDEQFELNKESIVL